MDPWTIELRDDEDFLSWEELIKEALADEDHFKDLYINIDSKELKRKFDTGMGAIEGVPFTAWSKNWIYFPAVYDGKEWVAKVPRHPCDIKTEHIGGGG